MFAFGIIFLVFFVIFGFTISRNKEISDSKTDLSKMNNCLLISSLLTSAYVNGDGITINTSIDHNTNVTDIINNIKGLNVEDKNCLLSTPNIPNFKLEKGKIRIENQNNYLNIENV